MQLPDLPSTFGRPQALALGVSGDRLTRAVRGGRLQRLASGLYALPDQDERVDSRRSNHLAVAESVLLRHPGGCVLSHLTAAAAHGLPLPLRPLSRVHLTVDGIVHRSRHLTGVTVHHGDSVLMHPVLASGLPCTSVARTLADCLRWNAPAVSVPLVDAAVRSRLCTLDDVETELACQIRWRGRPRAYAALALVDARRESWLESFGYLTLDSWGIDLPVPQVIVLAPGGEFIGRVDGIWAEDNTVLELDGKEKYLASDAGTSPDALDAERVRQHGLTNVGLEVVRVDLGALLRRRARVESDILERRRVGRSRRFTGELVMPTATGARWQRPAA